MESTRPFHSYYSNHNLLEITNAVTQKDKDLWMCFEITGDATICSMLYSLGFKRGDLLIKDSKTAVFKFCVFLSKKTEELGFDNAKDVFNHMHDITWMKRHIEDLFNELIKSY